MATELAYPQRVFCARLVEEVERDVRRRLSGPALGEEVDRVEHLERLDRADDDRDQEDRLHHREDEVAQLVPEACAEDPGRVHLVLRQRRQPGQEDQEHERRPLPDVDEHDRPDREIRVLEPLDRLVEAEDRFERLVDRAVLLEEHEEDEARDGRARPSSGAGRTPSRSRGRGTP